MQEQAEPQRIWSAVEVSLIVVLFFVAGGQKPPHVNESHYLTRSKHFWDPDWCAGDLFLESSEAHPVFHFTFGWMTNFLSLPAYAWFGRGVCWLALAAGWYRLSRSALGDRHGWHLFSAAVVVTLWNCGHMAGEWVVGGIEAKVPAYATVFLGMAELLKARWKVAIPIFGVATAFHPLVGGWALVASLVAWIFDTARPSIRSMLLPAIVALCLASPGLFAAVRLDHAVDAETIRHAHRTYVFRRLGHHLLIAKLPIFNVLRHLFLLIGWAWLWRLTSERRREDKSPMMPVSQFVQRNRRLQTFVLGCVVIAVAGAIIELITHRNPYICSDWMRYYWYRMSDGMLPVGASLALVAWISATSNGESQSATPSAMPTGKRGVVFSIALVLIAFSALSDFRERTLDRRAPADMQGRTDGRTLDARQQDDRDWKEVCLWCRQNTPVGSLFITPTHNQTFKWYAHRAEFASWKDTPQDSQSIVTWYARRKSLRKMGMDRWRAKPEALAMAKFMRDERVDYVLTARHYGDIHWHIMQPKKFRLLFQNEGYQLFRLVDGSAVRTKESD